VTPRSSRSRACLSKRKLPRVIARPKRVSRRKDRFREHSTCRRPNLHQCNQAQPRWRAPGSRSSSCRCDAELRNSPRVTSAQLLSAPTRAASAKFPLEERIGIVHGDGMLRRESAIRSWTRSDWCRRFLAAVRGDVGRCVRREEVFHPLDEQAVAIGLLGLGVIGDAILVHFHLAV
jgi:hypothetical protein